ncbi:response regulator [Myxococcota bacterium]
MTSVRRGDGVVRRGDGVVRRGDGVVRRGDGVVRRAQDTHSARIHLHFRTDCPASASCDTHWVHALLVEDSPIFAEALRLLLEEVGDEEIRLSHVERLASLAFVSDPRPDVVLLDLALPDAEGLDSVRGVQERLPGVPIVVLTADSDEEQALQMVRGGAQDYLVKGRFNLDTLIRAMRYAIERVQGEQLKHQLFQADRLAAVGRLAAGVAHEISNPATFVQANAGLLEEQLQYAEAALDRVSRALSISPSVDPALAVALQQARLAMSEIGELTKQNAAGVGRICSVVQDLRSYSRLEPGRLVCIHPNEVVDDVCGLVSNVVRHKARMIKVLADVPPVALPKGRLDQILTNLLVNAAQAIPDGAPEHNTIIVSTRGEEEAVIIGVEDTGPGMTPEQKRKLFEPFFTTKPRGVGLGLGLSICLEIARAHGGDMLCRSEPGERTRFEVRFPRMLERPPRALTPPPISAPAARLRVLLVDDEPRIREVFKLLLSDEFDVEVAADGHGALEIIEGQSNLDVVVSDLMMPDMDAAQLIEAVLRVAPRLAQRFILCTGGAVSERTRKLVDTGEIPVLYKPLLTDDLKVAIRQRLGTPRVAANSKE